MGNVTNEITIEGTNIPADPRKRTKNHARLEITIWADIPDSILQIVGFTCAADAMREMEKGFQESISAAIDMWPTNGEFTCHTRVSQ